MICTIQATAQYYENYSDTTSPYWKPKGGVDFHFPLSADLVLYTPKDVLVEALIKMVEEQSNEYARYEYLEHEVKFSQPIVVEGLGRVEGMWMYFRATDFAARGISQQLGRRVQRVVRDEYRIVWSNNPLNHI